MNLSFDIQCVRKQLSGICEDISVKCCTEFSQAISILESSFTGLPFAVLTTGVIQRIGTACVLNMTFENRGIIPGIPFAVLPVGFRPLSMVSIPVFGMPSFTIDILNIDTLGNMTFQFGFIPTTDIITVCVTYQC